MRLPKELDDLVVGEQIQDVGGEDTIVRGGPFPNRGTAVALFGACTPTEGCEPTLGQVHHRSAQINPSVQGVSR